MGGMRALVDLLTRRSVGLYFELFLSGLFAWAGFAKLFRPRHIGETLVALHPSISHQAALRLGVALGVSEILLCGVLLFSPVPLGSRVVVVAFCAALITVTFRGASRP